MQSKSCFRMRLRSQHFECRLNEALNCINSLRIR
nr:MAG TPA: hypothetical protein [Inoviridae sp.]